MIRAEFDENGLNLGKEQTDMAYLYGLSDFFSVMFEDTSVINLMMEAQTQNAAEIYSKFLYLASSLSIEDIQSTVGCSIKFVTINGALHPTTSTGLVGDEVNKTTNTYKLSEKFQSARKISNRPFLPTSTLEEDVDYRIYQDDTGQSYIQFASNIDNYVFSKRALSDGNTVQYALWFVDAQIDESMMYKYFGKLIGVEPENSSDRFSDFVYGLFYVYTQGPTLGTLRKGLNLSLGIPLARANETVLDIRTYLDTDQYLVITDQNQYIVPYGLEPAVGVGDELMVGDELAFWVEIKDYVNDGEWWINLGIPPSLIPSLPIGQVDRYAKPGTHFDYIMRSYLKKHTFLVKVNVQGFKDVEQFTSIADIIKKARPSYASPIYVWAVTTSNEELDIDDEGGFSVAATRQTHEFIAEPIYRFYRGNESDPLKRNAGCFIRYNAPEYVDTLCGEDPFLNGSPFNFNGTTVSKLIYPQSRLVDDTEISTYSGNWEKTLRDKSWVSTMFIRGSDTFRNYRSTMAFTRNSSYRGQDVTSNIDLTEGTGIPLTAIQKDLPFEARVLPLYVTTLADLQSKFTALGLGTVSSAWMFDILRPKYLSYAVDNHTVNEIPVVNAQPAITNVKSGYATLMFRTSGVNYFGSLTNTNSLNSWAPSQEDMQARDFIRCVKIQDKVFEALDPSNPNKVLKQLEDAVIGVYLITGNQTLSAPNYWKIKGPEKATITMAAPMNRGSATHGSSMYATRSALSYNNTDTDRNTYDYQMDFTSTTNQTIATWTRNFTDKYQTVSTSLSRNRGTVGQNSVVTYTSINHGIEL